MQDQETVKHVHNDNERLETLTLVRIYLSIWIHIFNVKKILQPV